MGYSRRTPWTVLRTPVCLRIVPTSFISVSIFSVCCYSSVSISVVSTFLGVVSTSSHIGHEGLYWCSYCRSHPGCQLAPLPHCAVGSWLDNQRGSRTGFEVAGGAIAWGGQHCQCHGGNKRNLGMIPKHFGFVSKMISERMSFRF